MRNFLIIL